MLPNESYEQLALERAEAGTEKRFINNRNSCRYCGVTDPSEFGRRDNAHAFPAALGNRVLFALDECKSCNQKFSLYEDALVKAIGPFLTLGGVKGRRSVRQTGRSAGPSSIKHTNAVGARRIIVRSATGQGEAIDIDQATGKLALRIPVEGDRFVPRYAYKALLKIGLSILPAIELPRFENAVASLNSHDALPNIGPLLVGFSYAYVGNALPALAAVLQRRKGQDAAEPALTLHFLAGSVCFQIWIPTDEEMRSFPNASKNTMRFKAMLPMPEGGYYPVEFTEPRPFDWAGISPILQPFEAFILTHDPKTGQGHLSPVGRSYRDQA